MYKSTAQIIKEKLKPDQPVESEERRTFVETLFRLQTSVSRYDRDTIREAEASNERRLRLKFRNMFGERYYRKDFSNYVVDQGPEQRHALNTCRTFAENIEVNLKVGKWLVLFGNKGTGKDHLSRAILMEAIRRGHQVEFGTIDKILRRIREGWRDHKRTEQEILDYFCKVELLLIHEIGVLGRADDAKAKTFEILDERYSRQRTTIITSNVMGKEEIGKQTVYGVDFWKFINFFGHDRLIDRFQEISITVPFTWGSNRGRV